MSRASDHIDESAAPLIEHLKELRSRILYSIGAFAVACLVGYLLRHPIFDMLSSPICHALANHGQKCQLVMIKMQEGFFVVMKLTVWAGFAIAFPVIALQLWRFVAPGLYRSEKNAFLPFLIASPVMFVAGAAFAYYLVLPGAFEFFLSWQSDIGNSMDTAAATEAAAQGAAAATGAATGPLADLPSGLVYQGSIESYLSLTMSFILAFGLCFQLPVLLSLMGRAGLISARGMRNTRKYAVVAILSLAAVVTPPDVMSQLIMFLAVYPLYEISIWLVARFERDREARMRADGTWVEDDEDEEEKA